MQISIQNIKEVTTNAFQDLVFDKTDTLVALKHFFEQDKNPLGDMIHNEFNYYWNDLFSKQVLHHSFVLPFPKFAQPSISIWLLNWKEYIENKYSHSHFSPTLTVRNMKTQDFQDEIDKLHLFFNYSKKPISQTLFESLESGLELNVPSYYSPNSNANSSNPFKEGFITAVFYMAKIKSFKNTVVREEDLKKFFQSYYSYFYKVGSREKLFNTSCNKQTDHVKTMEQRLDFLKPHNLEESSFFYHLDIPSISFATALNKVVGIQEFSDKTKENYAIMQLQTFFAAVKVEILEDKFQLNHNIKTKKLKI